MAPYRPQPGRSHLAVIAAVLCASAALAGCGGGSGAGGAASAHDGATVSVPSRYGTAEIRGIPRRVVAMSWTDADLALQLGVVPVGIARNATVPGGLEPWSAAAISAAGGHKPTLFSTAAGDPVETVAALKPDLILATKDYNLARSHAQLAGVAPVIGYRHAPDEDAWRADAIRVGRALHRVAAARKLVSSVDAQVRRTRASAHLAGRTYTWAISPTGALFYTINSTSDVSARFMSALGMRLGPSVRGLPTTDIPGRAKVSTERADVLRADDILLTGPPQGIAQFVTTPSVARVLRSGHTVRMSNATAQAIAFPSALSLRWVLRTIVADLSGSRS